MNENTFAQTSAQISTAPGIQHWIGVGLTVVVVLFLVFDGVTKVMRVPQVIDACQKVGIAGDLVAPIGVLLLVCTAVYVTPRTAILGAVLLTGYLGGAATVHVISRQGVFPIVFAIAFGVLVWTGLVLREPRLLRWIVFREFS